MKKYVVYERTVSGRVVKRHDVINVVPELAEDIAVHLYGALAFPVEWCSPAQIELEKQLTNRTAASAA